MYVCIGIISIHAYIPLDVDKKNFPSIYIIPKYIYPRFCLIVNGVLLCKCKSDITQKNMRYKDIL